MPGFCFIIYTSDQASVSVLPGVTEKSAKLMIRLNFLHSIMILLRIQAINNIDMPQVKTFKNIRSSYLLLEYMPKDE